ncbi:hypothetical protein IDM40_25100 [Nocardiopsis sp. HNM0947]|uniref:PH domain-containing protein n=1 Tax=Nocardiopsis coralli TaxID=2772213 RepID=A0ABR9PDM3_9ACTN|nr:hypothetical protein [Nocardiopsis coralli]MBE3001948.1 hypothetical protein [Nocardiopsis coralli]
MVELTPEEEYYYANASMAMLFDLAQEITTQLGGEYVALYRAARNEEERGQWIRLMREAHDIREGLDPDDRQALIDQITRWKAELSRVRGREN